MALSIAADARVLAPIRVFWLPVEAPPDVCPINVLLEPVVMLLPARYPNKALLNPVVISSPEKTPTAVF